MPTPTGECSTGRRSPGGGKRPLKGGIIKGTQLIFSLLVSKNYFCFVEKTKKLFLFVAHSLVSKFNIHEEKLIKSCTTKSLTYPPRKGLKKPVSSPGPTPAAASCLARGGWGGTAGRAPESSAAFMGPRAATSGRRSRIGWDLAWRGEQPGLGRPRGSAAREGREGSPPSQLWMAW